MLTPQEIKTELAKNPKSQNPLQSFYLAFVCAEGCDFSLLWYLNPSHEINLTKKNH